MYVYEIEYKDGYTRFTEYMYIVSSTDYDVSDYLRTHTNHEIIRIQRLGLCETIIPE